MDLSGSSYRISSHFIHYFNSPSITTGLQWIKGNLVRIRMSLFSVSLRNAKSCKFSKIFLSHTDVSYYDWAEVWVVILKWPVLIYQPFSKSVGLLVEFYNRAVHIHITYTTYLMQNFFNLIWYDTFAHTRPSPLESQKLSVSGQVGHSDAHFQMKKKKFHLTVDWMWIWLSLFQLLGFAELIQMLFHSLHQNCLWVTEINTPPMGAAKLSWLYVTEVHAGLEKNLKHHQLLVQKRSGNKQENCVSSTHSAWSSTKPCPLFFVFSLPRFLPAARQTEPINAGR